MFRALLFQSSRARDYNVDYHIGRSWFAVGWMLGAVRLEQCPGCRLKNQERNDQCGNQHHNRELLMMGIVVPETC
jgi:hypothetical protein